MGHMAWHRPWRGPCPKCGKVVALTREYLAVAHKRLTDYGLRGCGGGYVGELARIRREVKP